MLDWCYGACQYHGHKREDLVKKEGMLLDHLGSYRVFGRKDGQRERNLGSGDLQSENVVGGE